MSRKEFILEIEGFHAGQTLTTGIFSYVFPQLGGNQHPVIGKKNEKAKINSLFVRRAGDKYTPRFVSHAFSGKTFPRILLMDLVSGKGATIKRTFLTCTEVGIENLIPRDAGGEKTEDIIFHFQDYQFNI